MLPDGTPVRVVIADDHPIFREGVRRLFETDSRYRLVAEAADGATAVALVREHRPDILLLDFNMQGFDGLRVLEALSDDLERTRVVMLTGAIERDQILEAVQRGARGVLLKDAATPLLYRCMERVLADEYWLGRDTVADLVASLRPSPKATTPTPAATLTSREREIVRAVVDGSSNKDIAVQFGLSPQTVKNHLSAIFDKLGVSSRLELALYAVNHGIGREDER